MTEAIIDGSRYGRSWWAPGSPAKATRSPCARTASRLRRSARRTPSAVQAMADKLGVPRASINWRQTLDEIKPDIVAVATPAGVHAEVIEAALAKGLPRLLGQAACAVRAGRPASVRACPRCGCQARLRGHPPLRSERRSAGGACPRRRDRAVGEVEGTFRRHINPLTPWSWYDSVEMGGGLLHNALPHWMGILQRVLGGELQAAVGETRRVRERAPFVPDIHDFRLRGAMRPTAEEAEKLEWRDCDSDSGFTALLRIGTRDANHAGPGVDLGDGSPGRLAAERLALQRHRRHAPGRWPLLVHGAAATGPAIPPDQWEDLPIPQRILDDHPQVGDEFQKKWTALARDFVGDLVGQPRGPVPDLPRWLALPGGVRHDPCWQRLDDDPLLRRRGLLLASVARLAPNHPTTSTSTAESGTAGLGQARDQRDDSNAANTGPGADWRADESLRELLGTERRDHRPGLAPGRTPPPLAPSAPQSPQARPAARA